MQLFPDHWKTDPVNKLCTDVVDCVNKTAPVVEGPTDFKMIRTTNVKAGRINLDDCRFVDEATFVKWTRRIQPKRNDIVLTREAPLGEVGLLRSDESVFLGQRTMLYRANPKKLDQRFLYYSMLGPLVQGQIRSQGSGATVEHLRVPDAETFLIAYPPPDEQRHIAAILSAYDDLIANNQRRIALLESMAEEIYREFFARKRVGGVGHRLARFDELGRFEKGKTPAEIQSAPGEDLLPYLTADVMRGEPASEWVLSNRSVVSEAGEVLMLMDGSNSGEVFRGPAGVVASTAAVIRTAAVHQGIVYQYLRQMQEAIKWNNTGSAVPHANKDFINRMLVPVPMDDEVLTEFNNLHEPLYQQGQALKQMSAKLMLQRDSLLPRLISGKLRVDHLDIQYPPSMKVEAAQAA